MNTKAQIPRDSKGDVDVDVVLNDPNRAPTAIERACCEELVTLRRLLHSAREAEAGQRQAADVLEMQVAALHDAATEVLAHGPWGLSSSLECLADAADVLLHKLDWDSPAAGVVDGGGRSYEAVGLARDSARKVAPLVPALGVAVSDTDAVAAKYFSEEEARALAVEAIQRGFNATITDPVQPIVDAVVEEIRRRRSLRAAPGFG